jgi:hypothetical protein
MKTCNISGCDNPKPIRGARCGSCRNSIQRYGISRPEKILMLKMQGSTCKICKRDICFNGTANQYSACIDHCHSTGEVRGIICGNCNTWIGYFENRTIEIDAVKDYLCL